MWLWLKETILFLSYHSLRTFSYPNFLTFLSPPQKSDLHYGLTFSGSLPFSLPNKSFMSNPILVSASWRSQTKIYGINSSLKQRGFMLRPLSHHLVVKQDDDQSSVYGWHRYYGSGNPIAKDFTGRTLKFVSNEESALAGGKMQAFKR